MINHTLEVEIMWYVLLLDYYAISVSGKDSLLLNIISPSHFNWTIKFLSYLILLLGYIARLSENKSVSPLYISAALYISESCNIDFQFMFDEHMDLSLMKIICIKICFLHFSKKNVFSCAPKIIKA
jgi:hypothetical protein